MNMPELPDIAAYISAPEPRIVAQPIKQVRLASAFLLRSVQPPVTSLEGRIVRDLRRIGKRIALSLEGAEECSHMGKPDFRVGGTSGCPRPTKKCWPVPYARPGNWGSRRTKSRARSTVPQLSESG